MKKVFFMAVLLGLFAACGSNDDDNDANKDKQKPVISDQVEVSSPIDCQVYTRGEEIPVRYLLEDNVELGNFTIEIHNNFDHHSHGTSAKECKLDEKKAPVKPFVYKKDFTIPVGLKSYKTDINILIPADIDAGDYHFMLRLTDKIGWQELKAVSIKIK
ncbi:MAG TPA: DUF4625 domain-containing protein [Prevotella sp.]